MPTLVLIDGYSLMHRAFYALPALSTVDGVYTNAVFGFYNMLLRVIKDAQPDYLVVALDAHAPTFRHEAFADYKAGRKPMPEELRPQLALLRETLTECGIAQLEKPGFEADDILGTLSLRARQMGMECILVTGDRDAFQLIGEGVTVWFTRKGLSETEHLDRQALLDGYGVAPEQVPDLKGLMGDASDNIPGIAGIGEKTALKLLQQYGSLDRVLEEADTLRGKLGERVRGGRDVALMSRKLATIDRSAPLVLDLSSCTLPPLTALRPVFSRLAFHSLLSRLGEGQEAAQEDSRWTQTPLTQPQEAQAFLCGASSFAAALLPASLTLAREDGRLATLPLQGDLLSPGADRQEALSALDALSGPAQKRLYDVKAWRTELARLGRTLSGPVFDAAIAAYLIAPGEADTFEKLCRRSGRTPDAAALYDICGQLQEQVEAMGMKALYEEVELPLSDVLFSMEQQGFRVDREQLRALQQEFGGQMDRLQAEIYAASGETFNILSPKQLGEVLFEKLSLPAQKKTSRGYSTDAEVLEQLIDRHPVVPLVLQYRAASKLKSTYIDGLLKLSGDDGIVHTTLHQTVTATGRISSAEPNLQNIPVRTELGRVIRKVFVPRAPGWVLVDADYSQIELRVLAHMAAEANMCEAFRNGQDIHLNTAAQVFGVPVSEVTPAMRSSAKAVNFGIVYGISDFGLARNTGISRKEAAAFIERYFARYPAVRIFMDDCVARGRQNGYVTTLFGRRRPLPELHSSNYNTRSFGERAAMNTPIQGTAADIIKIAMVRVDRALKAEGLRARLILQVHDELIVDAPQEEASVVEALLRREMEGAAQLNVPLTADVHTGASWYETK